MYVYCKLTKSKRCRLGHGAMADYLERSYKGKVVSTFEADNLYVASGTKETWTFVSTKHGKKINEWYYPIGCWLLADFRLCLKLLSE